MTYTSINVVIFNSLIHDLSCSVLVTWDFTMFNSNGIVSSTTVRDCLSSFKSGIPSRPPNIIYHHFQVSHPFELYRCMIRLRSQVLTSQGFQSYLTFVIDENRVNNKLASTIS